MNRWNETLRQISRVQQELGRRQPWRDVGLAAPRGAAAADLAAAELRLGRALPPSYRAFLEHHDGWDRFFDGAGLLGTRHLGDRSLTLSARAIFDAAEAPSSLVAPRRGRAPLMPFGADADLTTLFAFNPQVMNADGEYEVIAWIGEIGMRRASFASFLELVLELCEGESAPGMGQRRYA